MAISNRAAFTLVLAAPNERFLRGPEIDAYLHSGLAGMAGKAAIQLQSRVFVKSTFRQTGRRVIYVGSTSTTSLCARGRSWKCCRQ